MSPDQNTMAQTECLAPPTSSASHSGLQKQKHIASNSNKTWNPKNFHTLSTVTKGTYSTIHLVQSSHTNNLYAVKARSKTAIQDNDETDSIHTEKEVLLLTKKEKHPFTVEVFGGFQTPSHILLYLEFCKRGNLSQYLRNGGRFDIEKTR